VLSVVSRFATSFTPLNTATAIHRLAKLSRGSGGYAGTAGGAPQPVLADDRFAYLAGRAEWQLDGMSPRQVATLLWALAKIGHDPAPPFWAKAEDYIARELRRFSARGALFFSACLPALIHRNQREEETGCKHGFVGSFSLSGP
jgi:hypothetical protein